MSLEAKIEALTQAVQALTAQLQTATVAPAAPVAQAPVVAPAPVPTPVVASAPVALAPAMPAPPAFMAAAPAAAVVGAPFNDSKGLIEYVMDTYKAMGPQKGSRIQEVMTALGYQNINDIKPEHYGALYQGVEQLKGA